MALLVAQARDCRATLNWSLTVGARVTRRASLLYIGGATTRKEDSVDEDLADLDRDALAAEVKRLRAGIREHRDSSRHELCWHHPSLWGLLPERTDPLPVVPEWPEFMRGCVRYRQSLDEQAPDAPRTSEPYTK